MPKKFSEKEKKQIYSQLKKACEKSWNVTGYRKTSVDSLCKTVGISKGAFYIFFENKNELFFEVYKDVQEKMYLDLSDTLDKEPNKYGMAHALKDVYKLYSKSNFMYDTKNDDFQELLTNLGKSKVKELTLDSGNHTRAILRKSYLKLKIDEDLAMSILATLLRTISFKSEIKKSSEVFEFLIDRAVEDILE